MNIPRARRFPYRARQNDIVLTIKPSPTPAWLLGLDVIRRIEALTETEP